MGSNALPLGPVIVINDPGQLWQQQFLWEESQCTPSSDGRRYTVRKNVL